MPGTYWLRAHDDDRRRAACGRSSSARCPRSAEKEPNDDAGQAAGDRTAGVVVNGRLEKTGDVDCFAVTLKKGQTLVAVARGATARCARRWTACLQVVSPDGFVLEQNNDHRGLDPQIAFTAPKDGTYVVRVFAFPATPDSSIRFAGADAYVYRLTLTTGGFADHALPLAVPREARQRSRWSAGTSPNRRAPSRSARRPEAMTARSCRTPGVANPVRGAPSSRTRAGRHGTA